MHKILIADDELYTWTLVEKVLPKIGYDGACLSSGKYVLDIVNAARA